MWWCGWIMFICNAVVPQLLLVQVGAAATCGLLFVVCILVNVGMWFERFVIIVVGLHRDFLPSSWGTYCPSYVEVLTLLGSFGLFLTLFLLFCRYLPMVAMAEVKSILPRRPAARRPEVRHRPPNRAAQADGMLDDRHDRQCPRLRPGERPALGPAGRVPRRRPPCAPRPTRSATPATSGGTATRPSRSTAWTGRWASAGRPAVARAWRPALAGCADRPGHAVVRQLAAHRQQAGRDLQRLSAGLQRQALLEPAGAHSDRLRADGAVRSLTAFFGLWATDRACRGCTSRRSPAGGSAR